MQSTISKLFMELTLALELWRTNRYRVRTPLPFRTTCCHSWQRDLGLKSMRFMSAAAEYHAAVGEWAEAIAAYHRALSLYPDDASLRIGCQDWTVIATPLSKAIVAPRFPSIS